MKHLNLSLEKLEERIAPWGAGGHSKGSGNGSNGSGSNESGSNGSKHNSNNGRSK